MNAFDEDCIDDSDLTKVCLPPASGNLPNYDQECSDDSVLNCLSLPSPFDLVADIFVKDLNKERNQIHELYKTSSSDHNPDPEAELESIEDEEEKENGNGYRPNTLLPSPMRVYSIMGQSQNKNGLSLPELLTYWNIVKDEAAKKLSYTERIHEHCMKWGQVTLDSAEAKKKIAGWADNEKKVVKPLLLPPRLNMHKLSFMQPGYCHRPSESKKTSSSNPVQSSLLNRNPITAAEKGEVNLFQLCKPVRAEDMMIPSDKMKSISSWIHKVLEKNPPTVGIAMIHGRTGIGKKEALALILKPFPLDIFHIFFSTEEKPEVNFLNRLSHHGSPLKRCFIIADCDVVEKSEEKKLQTMWNAILKEKQKAKDKILPTSVLFLFVCNSPFQNILNRIRKQSFVKVWNLFPKHVHEFKKFYLCVRTKLEQLGPLHESSFPKELHSLHRLNQICETQDVRQLLNQMVFLYRTMKGVRQSKEVKRDSTCRVPLSNFDYALAVLSHQLPYSVKKLPSLTPFQHSDPTRVLRQIFSVSRPLSTNNDGPKGNEFESLRQMVKFVDQHNRETTPLIIAHNIVPMALGFHNVTGMNQAWIRMFSDDVERLASKDFKTDLQSTISYGNAGKKEIDRSIYRLFRVLGSYFPDEKNLPDHAQEWLVASCLQITPALGTRTRYDQNRPFIVSYPTATDQLVKKKFDMGEKKSDWLNGEWDPMDQAQLFSKSEDELFLLYGHTIEQYVEIEREPAFRKGGTDEEETKKKGYKRKKPTTKKKGGELELASSKEKGTGTGRKKMKVETKDSKKNENKGEEEKKKKKPQRKPRKPTTTTKARGKGKGQENKEDKSQVDELVEGEKKTKEKKIRKTRKDKGIKRGPKNKNKTKMNSEPESALPASNTLKLEPKEEEETPTSVPKVEEQPLSFNVLKNSNKPNKKANVETGGVKPVRKKRKANNITSQKTTLLELWKPKQTDRSIENSSNERSMFQQEIQIQMEKDEIPLIEEKISSSRGKKKKQVKVISLEDD